jgi:hypothetical protein
MRPRDSIVVKALCCKSERLRPNGVMFSIYLILPPTIGPGVHLASNRNEYQKQKNVSGGVESGRCVGMITLPPSVS